MQTWLALFRGINVGGRNVLPMADLRARVEEIGGVEAKTYIQSGNVVFQSRLKSASSLSKKLSQSVMDHHGFRPNVLLLNKSEFAVALKNNPFAGDASDPRTLHFFFLDRSPEDPDLDKLESVKKKTETFHLIGQVFYLHAPDGIARSKLAASVEKILAVSTTARNFRTVTKLTEMLGTN